MAKLAVSREYSKGKEDINKEKMSQIYNKREVDIIWEVLT